MPRCWKPKELLTTPLLLFRLAGNLRPFLYNLLWRIAGVPPLSEITEKTTH